MDLESNFRGHSESFGVADEFQDQNTNDTENIPVQTPTEDQTLVTIEGAQQQQTPKNSFPSPSSREEPKLSGTPDDKKSGNLEVEQIKSITSGQLHYEQPLRTDPIKALEARKRRLDRNVELSLPEIHFIGDISHGKGILSETWDGALCRWKIDHGKAWELLSGDQMGQTQIAYIKNHLNENLIFNHPLDLHFAASGLQGWGAPRISVQCYRLDFHGRMMLCGYGFAHLPITPGPHQIEIDLWRPVGTPEDELKNFLLGISPALIHSDPIYDTAWKDRCRLLTCPAGKITANIFTLTRNLASHNVDKTTS